jgi:hypothetical protein
MATDPWVPRRFAQLSDRLVTNNGIWLMGLAALATLLYTRGSVSKLLVMYAINVFVTFSLTLIGMTRHDKRFYVGTFGEEEGPAELAVFDKNFSGYTLPFESLHPLVGLAWSGNALYGVEIFPHDDPWTADNANLVSFDARTGKRTEVLADFASLPNGLIVGPDGALYTSNQGMTAGGGDGGILRISR